MSQDQQKLDVKRTVDWISVITNLQIYLSSLIGLYLIGHDVLWSTIFFSIGLIVLSILGVTAGSHRLWAHQSYKASKRLRIFLMLCQTLAGHGTIYSWVQRHRLHHKYFKTDIDPYNPSKGFAYSHFIADCMFESPAQVEKIKEVDMSDVKKDGIVMFQRRFYWPLLIIVTMLLPINAPAEYFGESLLNSVFIAGFLRFGITMQLSRLIHSATLVWDISGDEKDVYESNLVFLINKTFWLSYHYLAPWDYQTSEYGKYGNDCTTKFIRACAALELATDLKTTTSEIVQEALKLSTDENKPITECLLDSYKVGSIPKDHFLTPKNFYRHI